MQKRIKDQQWPNADFSQAKKIDITIVVDMLLTGFDSKYLNTLYVDKNLRHHGLIQAFSRSNRVLNGSKPYGNILDFRQQQEAVDAAIALFSGQKTAQQAREIWLVDPAPVVIRKLEAAVMQLDSFMKSQGLASTPEAVPNLKGDAARVAFINHFKEIQRLKTQLDQYTDLSPADQVAIEQVLPNELQRGFKGAYLETAQRLREQRLISETSVEISWQGIQNSSAVLYPVGSVLISRDAGVGKSAIMQAPMAVSQHFIVWICKPGELSNWFLYHLLQFSKPIFERAAIGSTIKTIGLKFFIDLVFKIPALPEQQRIADCLSSLDALITAESQKLEALKRHKRGLMQQLFPGTA